jgi:hypothetical protein
MRFHLRTLLIVLPVATAVVGMCSAAVLCSLKPDQVGPPLFVLYLVTAAAFWWSQRSGKHLVAHEPHEREEQSCVSDLLNPNEVRQAKNLYAKYQIADQSLTELPRSRPRKLR